MSTAPITPQSLASRRLRAAGLCHRCRQPATGSRCDGCREIERTAGARYRRRSRTRGRPITTNHQHHETLLAVMPEDGRL